MFYGNFAGSFVTAIRKTHSELNEPAGPLGAEIPITLFKSGRVIDHVGARFTPGSRILHSIADRPVSLPGAIIQITPMEIVPGIGDERAGTRPAHVRKLPCQLSEGDVLPI